MRFSEPPSHSSLVSWEELEPYAGSICMYLSERKQKSCIQLLDHILKDCKCESRKIGAVLKKCITSDDGTMLKELEKKMKKKKLNSNIFAINEITLKLVRSYKNKLDVNVVTNIKIESIRNLCGDGLQTLGIYCFDIGRNHKHEITKKKLFKKSEQCFLAHLKRNPMDRSSYWRLGLVYEKLQEAEECIKYFRMHMKYGDKRFGGFDLARALYKINKKKEGWKWFEIQLKEDGNGRNGYIQQARTMLTCSYTDDHDMDILLKVLDNAEILSSPCYFYDTLEIGQLFELYNLKKLQLQQLKKEEENKRKEFFSQSKRSNTKFDTIIIIIIIKYVVATTVYIFFSFSLLQYFSYISLLYVFCSIESSQNEHSGCTTIFISVDVLFINVILPVDNGGPFHFPLVKNFVHI